MIEFSGLRLIGYISAVAVGLSLGLIGGGGSILSVPILVYLFGYSPEDSAAYSMIIVGLSALNGIQFYWKKGLVKPSKALVFAIPSALGVTYTRMILLPSMPDQILEAGGFSLNRRMTILGVFAIIMLLSARKLIRGGNKTQTAARAGSPGAGDQVKLVLLGALTGSLTGFVGAGGGFLIVPLLMNFAGFQIKEAVGTSLMIIAINSCFGFTASYSHIQEFNLWFIILYSFLAMLGVQVGTKLGERISSQKLEPIFGWFILVMGIYVIAKEFM